MRLHLRRWPRSQADAIMVDYHCDSLHHSSLLAGGRGSGPFAQGLLSFTELLRRTVRCGCTFPRMSLGVPYIPLRLPYQLLSVLLIPGCLHLPQKNPWQTGTSL